MVGGVTLLPEILDQPDPLGAKSPRTDILS